MTPPPPARPAPPFQLPRPPKSLSSASCLVLADAMGLLAEQTTP
eukprot:COSAG01_NODE_4990_length_4562_cov_9.170961_9_plen_44_part_00